MVVTILYGRIMIVTLTKLKKTGEILPRTFFISATEELWQEAIDT